MRFFAPLAIVPLQSSATTLILAGPEPNGWPLLVDVEPEANLAIDVGYMYEFAVGDTSKRLDLYKTGRSQDQGLTLQQSLEIESRYGIEGPIRNYYVNCFDQVGQMDNENSGYFDGSPVHNYADTLILDLFAAESGSSTPTRGIEKEAVLILGSWMRVYDNLYQTLKICAVGKVYYSHEFESAVSLAAAFWIGRLQVYGDNTSGTMLYNLAERAAVNFNQDNGEAEVNTKFISILEEMRSAGQNCHDQDPEGYHDLYRLLDKMVGVMFTPLIQNLIHYIATDADPKLIELYLLALLPQIRSCNPNYFELFFTHIGYLSSGDYSIEDMVDIIDYLQSMYSCFGITCKDVGFHTTGVGCDDGIVAPNVPLAGYVPNNDVRNVAKFDRDVNQIAILLIEMNTYSALEIYRKGKNVKNVMGENQIDGNIDSYFDSLQDLALHKDLRDVTIDEHNRLYSMYEKFYDTTDFADHIAEAAFEDIALAVHTIPVLLKAMVLPQYAIRSFFAAVDVCSTGDNDAAENFWDRGVAVLVGSIEATRVVMDGNDGMSWWNLVYKYCAHFKCAEIGIDPPSLQKMMTNIELGRQSIKRSDCATATKRVQAMESIIVIPIIQGLLYHSAERQRTEEESHYGAAYAFGKAIMPVISVRRKADVDVIGDSLYTPGEFDASDLWTAIILALPDFGIDCKDLGEDTMQILGGKSFCDYVQNATEFPTAAPNKNMSRRPTPLPTESPTPSDASTEINSVLIDGYTFTNQTQALDKAKIALDLRDFLALRGHVDIEHAKAKQIYLQGSHSSQSLEDIGLNMQEKMANDPFFNLYRNSFRNDPLFENNQGEDDTYANIYAHKIFTDALEAEIDVELAYEVAVCMTMWMEVAHLLNAAVTSCGNPNQPAYVAGKKVDDALAFYVGVSQTKGSADGYLLYSLAQKSGSVFGTVDDESGEALANTSMMQYFKKAKSEANECDGTHEQAKELRTLIGSMMSKLNVPLVQNFVHQLQVGSQNDRGSAYAILYGLAVLPQVATCQPTEYYYLTREITTNGLDVANIDDLTISFRKTYDCFGITCSDVHGSDDQRCKTVVSQNTYAGFTPNRNVLSNSLIDQDILKIEAFLSENATIPALAYYKYGHLSHSLENQETMSLRDIAKDPVWKQNTFFNQLRSYHDGDDFADKQIMLALLKESPFDDTRISSNERKSLVIRSLQTLVLFPTAIGHMYKAATDCTFQYWDEGAVYLIGSVEGSRWGGDDMYSGVGMYGFAKELCEEFKVCTSSGNAETNERLIGYFSNGEDLISGGSCAALQQLIETKVVPTLLTALVQGAIHFAGKSSARGDAYVMAEAILPFLSNIEDSKANAMIIEGNLLLNSTGDSTKVIDAFSHLLVDMDVNCDEVGLFEGNQNLTLCAVHCDEVGLFEGNQNLTRCFYDPDQSTDLSDGLYITGTYVKERALIGLDVKQMIEKLNAGNIKAAELVYNEGWNSNIIDKTGKRLGFRSIASLSNNTVPDMEKEPIYNLYQYALGDVMNENVDAYAHNIVLQFFDEKHIFNSGHKALAAEAAVALVIWGYIVHELYETIDRCRNYGVTTDEDGVHSIDEAVAYWIGEGQETGSKTSGYLLYRLAEEGGELFGQKSNDSQSRANRNVLKLFKEASLHLAFDEACGESHMIISTLGSVMDKILAQMTVPLIQHLIYNLKKNDRGRVRIYAHSVVPLLASCTPKNFEFLKEKLIVKSYEVAEVDKIITYLQSSYSCLGLKCNDVGTLEELPMPQCVDRKELYPLGGFIPTTDIREYSDIDFDIRFIDIMMKQDAKEAALKIYTFGKHSIVTERNERRTLSLRELAVTTGRQIVPSFDTFTNYYDKAGLLYVDDLIRNELNSPATEGYIEQKRALVVSAMKYEVLHFAALQKLYDAADGCSSLDENRYFRARREWDTAAAMIIGPTDGSNGNLLYELAASQCAEFNTCDTKTGEAKINQSIEASFYAGSYLLKSKSCKSVGDYANNIENLLKVALIQATLYYAMKNNDLPIGTNDPSFAEGYIISRSILPYIDAVDADAAATIKENLDFKNNTKPVIRGSDAVFDAFETAISKMTDLDCKDVGYLDSGKDVCGSGSSSSAPTNILSYTMMIGILIAFAILTSSFF